MSTNVHQKPLTPIGFQQLASFNGAAVKLTVPAGCTHIFWSAAVGNVVYRDDANAPTATVGQFIFFGVAGDFYPGDPEQASANLRLIGVAAGSVLNVTYYKA